MDNKINKPKIVKIITAVTLSVICSFALFSCGTFSNNDVPSGYIDKTEHFQEEGVQDYTDYCKYIYESPDPFIDNKEYKIIEEGEIENIKIYFDDFQSWMIASDRNDEYDFNKGCISEGDYIKLITKVEDDMFSNYTLYFFDVESLTLYYIHNNI